MKRDSQVDRLMRAKELIDEALRLMQETRRSIEDDSKTAQKIRDAEFYALMGSSSAVLAACEISLGDRS